MDNMAFFFLFILLFKLSTGELFYSFYHRWQPEQSK